jgi:hypothetical protein
MSGRTRQGAHGPEKIHFSGRPVRLGKIRFVFDFPLDRITPGPLAIVLDMSPA